MQFVDHPQNLRGIFMFNRVVKFFYPQGNQRSFLRLVRTNSTSYLCNFYLSHNCLSIKNFIQRYTTVIGNGMRIA